MMDCGSMTLWSFGGPKRFVDHLETTGQPLDPYILKLYSVQHDTLCRQLDQYEWLQKLIRTIKSPQ